jgi:hypothetical protein
VLWGVFIDLCNQPNRLLENYLWSAAASLARRHFGYVANRNLAKSKAPPLSVHSNSSLPLSKNFNRKRQSDNLNISQKWDWPIPIAIRFTLR